MSSIGLIMDVLLGVLLVAALLFGFRLERKLKALREGQATFVGAVADLDMAARRAEAGLASLREATDEAHDSLHDRILKARELKLALEGLIDRAERVRAMPAAVAPAAPAAPPLVGSDRVRAAFAAVTEARAAAAAQPLPSYEGRPVPVSPIPTPVRPAAAPRRFDDDLFESAGDRR